VERPRSVAAWMQAKLGREVDPRRGWNYLQRWGYSTRVPLPQHVKADEETQRTFKKTAKGAWRRSARRIRKPAWNSGVPMSIASVSRPILRRVWALKGSAVKAVVAQRYEWMYVYACVHPESGRTSWLLMRERECRDLLTSPGSLCSTSQALVQTNAWCCCWTGLAGTRAQSSSFPRASIWCFCHPIHQKCNQPSACGRSPMNRWPIAPLLLLTTWNRSRWNAVGGYKLILHSFTPTPVSIGGQSLRTLLKRSSYDVDGERQSQRVNQQMPLAPARHCLCASNPEMLADSSTVLTRMPHL
jgi:Winged helix-turn helix